MARPLLARGVRAEDVDWDLDWNVALAGPGVLSAPAAPAASLREVRLSRSLIELLECISHFRHPGRWELMYRLAYRASKESPRLLEDEADRDVRHARSMERAIERECHRMHAFVRFRELKRDDGATTWFAWFEPEHEILPRAAPFFVNRFANAAWTIATPDGAAVWEGGIVRFIDAPLENEVPRFGEWPAQSSRRPQQPQRFHQSQRPQQPQRFHQSQRPQQPPRFHQSQRSQQLPSHPLAPVDTHESLWRTYYRSICNVSRINPATMQREMPQRYWRNMPETSEIPSLVRDGLEIFSQRHSEIDDTALQTPISIQRALADLPSFDSGPAACRRCDLWQRATQAVLGQGPPNASLFLVGEQPGDEEDLRGQPFVGPAGKLLDEALRDAGLSRPDLYITNAVKHFKWEPRGKRRLHKRPSTSEVAACSGWLEQEITSVQPRVIVALGATALRAVAGFTDSVETARGLILRHSSGARIVCTYHPSAVLRAEPERARNLRERLIDDLRRAGELSRSVPEPMNRILAQRIGQ